jgi:peroxiredoxin
MRPLVAVVIVLALVVAAAAIGFFSGPPRHDASASAARPAPPPVTTAAPPAASSPPPATPPRSRPGKVLPLAEAMKELDLIRPARTKAAEDFSLPMPGGGTFKLSEHRGKVVMINFWATWCPPCLEEMPAMERLFRKQKDTGFTLVAVSVDTDGAKISPFVSEHKLTFPIALDPKMDLANGYAVRALPSSFLVGRDGNLAALAIGPRHWDGDAALSVVEGLAAQH